MKIKTTLFSLSGLIAVAPIALTFTSCSGFYSVQLKNMGVAAKNFANEGDENTNYAQLSKANQSFYNLYLGNKSVNHGNYVIFLGCFGSTTINQATTPESATTVASITSNNGFNLFNKNFYNIVNSVGENYEAATTLSTLTSDESQPFNQGYDVWKGSGDHNYDIQFFSYFQSYKYISYTNGAKLDNTAVGGDIQVPCSPWYKWSAQDFKNPQFNPKYKTGDENKKYKDQNSWEKKHQVNKYARNDAAAKQYRDLFNTLYTLSPTHFTDKPNGESQVIALYIKNGKQNDVKTYQTDDSTSFHDDLEGIYSEHTLS